MSAVTYKCPNCDAALAFEPASGEFACKFCESSFKKEILDGIPVNEEDIEKSMSVYTCPSCAAEIITDQNTTATFCAFCHNPTVLSGKMKGKFQPKKIIPFKIDRKKALDMLMEYCKKKPLLPKEFTTSTSLEKITGIYVPFWLYDCNSSASCVYLGKRLTVWTSGNYQYTKTDTYRIARDGKAEYAKIPADGGKNFDDVLMDKLEPFDYSDLTDFSTTYLSGFFAENYDVSESENDARIKTRCDEYIKMQIEATLNRGLYNTVIPESSSTGIDVKNTDYVLLPVWMLTYKFNEKTHLFAINGQTGRMVGDLPVSIKRLLIRLLALGAACSAAVFAVITLISLLIV